MRKNKKKKWQKPSISFLSSSAQHSSQEACAACGHWVLKGCSFLGLLPGVLLGRYPDGKAECNLVHKVSKVVHQVQSAVSNTTHEISKEVAKRVDRPTHRHNEAHGGERGLHVLAHTSLGNLARFPCKDLEQDESPARHAENKASCWGDGLCLTCIAEGEHSHSAKQQAPEHALGEVRLHCRQDQVELNHLQRHCDGPINVTVQDGRCANLDPELAHVEVVHCCDQGHKSTDIHGGHPVTSYGHGLHQEEHSGSHHGDGDDPEAVLLKICIIVWDWSVSHSALLPRI